MLQNTRDQIAALLQLLSGAGAILLQREIPEAVNIEVAKVSCP